MSEVFGSFSELVIYFALYSFYGWICETLYCSFYEKRYVSRGFLSGPYCPIYGTGALAMLAVALPLAFDPVLVFLTTVVVASVLECFTSWVFETLFQLRLWDYSNQKWNIKGRVCLLNAVLFGLLGLAAVYLVHPPTAKFVAALKPEVQSLLGSLLVVVLGLDFLNSVAAVSGLGERLRELHELLREIGVYQRQHGWLDNKDLSGSLGRLREICREDAGNPRAGDILTRLDALLEVRDRGYRLVSNYPTLKPRQELAAEFSELRRVWLAGADGIFSGSENGMRKTERLISRFKAGVRKAEVCELIWVFIAGSVLGYFGRAALHLLKTGELGSVQSLLYGPFVLMYGIGAVLAVVMSGGRPPRKGGLVFVVCALLGGLLEFVVYRLDGKILGMHFWGYGEDPLSWESTGIFSMLIWGCLGKLLIERVRPGIVGWLKRLSRRQKRVLTTILVVFLATDAFVSVSAVSRWSDRHRGLPAENGWQRYLDGRWPDEKLGKIYPGARFVVPERIGEGTWDHGGGKEVGR